MGTFHYFEHTADVGMRVEAPDLSDLLMTAALGVSNLLVPDPETVEHADTRSVELENDDLDFLFFDWLSELLYLFEADGFVGKEYRLTMTGTSHLSATITGEEFDPEKHPSGNELKAVTYHGLLVEASETGYIAEVIFDI